MVAIGALFAFSVWVYFDAKKLSDRGILWGSPIGHAGFVFFIAIIGIPAYFVSRSRALREASERSMSTASSAQPHSFAPPFQLDPPSAAPGWYPDPLRRHDFRYWDGGAWTSTAASNGVTVHDAPS